VPAGMTRHMWRVTGACMHAPARWRMRHLEQHQLL
jgi:hypothetical protein